MKEELKPIPCGFCDQRDPLIVEPNGITHKAFYLECPRCGRKSPKGAGNRNMAIHSWNEQPVGIHAKDVGRFLSFAGWVMSSDGSKLAIALMVSSNQHLVLDWCRYDYAQMRGPEALAEIEMKTLERVVAHGLPDLPRGTVLVPHVNADPLGFFEQGGSNATH